MDQLDHRDRLAALATGGRSHAGIDAALATQIRMVGVNLNQLARQANRGQHVVVDLDLLAELTSLVGAVRLQLGDRGAR